MESSGEAAGGAVERGSSAHSGSWQRKGWERPPDLSLRVTDAEREKVVEQLRLHLSVGRLDMDEFAERTEHALAARTAGDLAPLTADLPTMLSPTDQARKLKRKRDALVQPYLSVMALLIGIWLATSLAAGELIFFWPIFPMLGWGIPVLFELRDLQRRARKG